MKCPSDYKNCKCYNPNLPEESRCNTDSTIGYCVEEYFKLYESSEVITENGGSK